jgi:hypothetical protein
MKIKICILLILIIFGVLFIKYTNNHINKLSNEINTYETHLNMRSQKYRDYELEIFKAFVDTILLSKKYFFTEQDVENFFTLDSICYVEKIDNDTLRVHGLDYYFIFNNGILIKDSSDFYKVKQVEFSYYLHNKKIYYPYIPYCID